MSAGLSARVAAQPVNRHNEAGQGQRGLEPQRHKGHEFHGWARIHNFCFPVAGSFGGARLPTSRFRSTSMHQDRLARTLAPPWLQIDHHLFFLDDFKKPAGTSEPSGRFLGVGRGLRTAPRLARRASPTITSPSLPLRLPCATPGRSIRCNLRCRRWRGPQGCRSCPA